MADPAGYTPGGDAKAIAEIAKRRFGSFGAMFVHHGWPERGSDMMRKVQTRVVETYGSVRAFEDTAQSQLLRGRADDIWERGYSVLFTSLWGWTPEDWGTIGWTGDRGFSRRANLLEELTDPFITVCYVTGNKSYIDPDLKGKIAGFYLVSHEMGDRDEFTHPIHHGENVGKWAHSLRALRAFSYRPESRLDVRDLDPQLLARARSVSAMGEVITDLEQLRLLRETPWTEVDVYTSSAALDARRGPIPARPGMVPAGPASDEGYVVAGGSQWLPRELYVLKLKGDIENYLGHPAEGRVIVKVGLSASPDHRRQSFQKAMPRGAFHWVVDRTTSSCGLPFCASHAHAVRGEDAMKRHLAVHAEWLGGEFYLAAPSVVDVAWQLACEAVERGAIRVS